MISSPNIASSQGLRLGCKTHSHVHAAHRCQALMVGQWLSRAGPLVPERQPSASLGLCRGTHSNPAVSDSITLTLL